MIKPSIGRVVWYWPHGVKAMSQPHSAQIAYVHTDFCVNLGYLDENGVARNATSVRLVQEGEPKPEFGYAEWMPYQRGQAAKNDALDEKIAALKDAAAAEPTKG